MTDSMSFRSTFKTWTEIEKEAAQYKKEHLYLSWFAENIHYPLIRFKNNIEELPKQIKWFIQRGIRGWSDYDAWNSCDYNSRVMSEALAYLSCNINGYPIGLSFKSWKNKLEQASWLYWDLSRTDNLKLKDRNKILRKLTKIMEKYYFDWWD